MREAVLFLAIAYTAKPTSSGSIRGISQLTSGDILRNNKAMAKEYIEQRNSGYFIEGTRVSLDSVVYAFLRGESPEGIAESFPALTLEQIFGALAFYLAHQEQMDSYLSEGRREFETLRREARHNYPALYAKLDEARQKSNMPSA